MAKSLYLKIDEFPGAIGKLNQLADAIKEQTGVRPSLRQLGADVLEKGAAQRIIETQIQSAAG